MIILVLLVKIIMIVNGKFETFTRVSGKHNDSIILSCSGAEEHDQYQWYQVSGDRFYQMKSEVQSMNLDFLKVTIRCDNLQVFGCRYANIEDLGYDVFTVQCSESGQREFMKQKLEAIKAKVRKNTTKTVKNSKTNKPKAKPN